MKKVLVLLCVALISVSLQSDLSAQSIFKEVMKKTGSKVEDNVTDKAADKIADKLSDLLNKKIDEAMEEDADAEGTEGEQIPGYGGRNWGDGPTEQENEIMASLFNFNAELPAEYKFDIAFTTVVRDEEGEFEIDWLFSDDDSYAAMSGTPTPEESQEDPEYIVIDNANKVMVMYSIKDGKKMGVKLPNLAAIGQSAGLPGMEDDDAALYESGKITVTKTGNNPVIMGKQCIEYKVDNVDEKEYTLVSVSPDVDFDLGRFYTNMLSLDLTQKLPHYEAFEKGMMMRTTRFTKDTDEQVYEMEVIEIDNAPASIINSEWDFTTPYAPADSK